MRNAKPCSVCGKMTGRLLFSDKILSVPICSRKCEYEYIQSLNPDTEEQMSVVHYLDEKIQQNKRYNRIGWLIAGLGLALIVFGFLKADAVVFILGNVIVASGTLSTRHFEDEKDKLVRLRKRIVI